MKPIADRAQAFTAAYPLKSRNLSGQEWNYYAGGQGIPLLLLTGGAGIGIAWMDLGLALHGRYRLIAIDYPPVRSFFGLAEGLSSLLEAEDIESAHVVGQSMGAMLAEIFSRFAPAKVRSLVLSGGGFYGEEDKARLAGKLQAMQTSPWDEMRAVVRKSLRSTWADSADADFWIDEIDRFNAGEVGRDRTMAPYHAFLDLIDRLPALQNEPAWSGPTLFIRGQDDLLITQAHFERLQSMHPQAELRSYETGGHSLLLTRPEDYIRDVEEFLARQNA